MVKCSDLVYYIRIGMSNKKSNIFSKNLLTNKCSRLIFQTNRCSCMTISKGGMFMQNQTMSRSRVLELLNQKKTAIFQVLSFIFILAICVCFLGFRVTKADHPHTQKQITKVEIKGGDNVWNIAEQYYSSEFGSLNEYIQEIEKINGISAEHVQAGGMLTIPYYEKTPVNYQ